MQMPPFLDVACYIITEIIQNLYLQISLVVIMGKDYISQNTLSKLLNSPRYVKFIKLDYLIGLQNFQYDQ
jgi:hypothetical protein